MVIELSQKISNERRFPAADFAGDHGKAGAVQDAEFEHGKCQSVILAPIDQIRVRQDRKRFLAKPIKRLIHRKTLRDATSLRSMKD